MYYEDIYSYGVFHCVYSKFSCPTTMRHYGGHLAFWKIWSHWIVLFSPDGSEVILNALIACKMKETAILLLLQCISNNNNGPQSWGIMAAILDFREYKLNEGLYLAKLDQRCYNEDVFIQKYAWIIPFYSKCKTKIQKYCQIDFRFFQALTLISF